MAGWRYAGSRAPGPARGAMAAVLILAVAVGCRSESQEQDDSDPAVRPLAVTFIEATVDDVEDTEQAVASVTAKRAPAISAEIDGTVQQIRADEGNVVERGDVLAVLDRTDYEIERRRAGAEARRLEVLVEQKAREIERHERLREGGHTPQSRMDDLEAEHAALVEEVEAARSDFESADRNLARTAIRAPYEGVIAARLVSEGEFVEAGTHLFALTTNAVLQIRIPLPETVAGRIETGQRVRLWRSGEADRIYHGTVGQIAPQVEEGSRAVAAIVEMSNPDNWPAGTSANAEIIVEERRSIVVPTLSVVRRPSGLVVYIAEDDRVHEREVRTGRSLGEDIEIVDGLAEGERVVVDGAGFLSDGAFVEPSPHQRPVAAAEAGASSGN